jgi:hypothetical protein
MSWIPSPVVPVQCWGGWEGLFCASSLAGLDQGPGRWSEGKGSDLIVNTA